MNQSHPNECTAIGFPRLECASQQPPADLAEGARARADRADAANVQPIEGPESLQVIKMPGVIAPDVLLFIVVAAVDESAREFYTGHHQ
jgi:hypothetical protein